jgi:hypothetical protein
MNNETTYKRCAIIYFKNLIGDKFFLPPAEDSQFVTLWDFLKLGFGVQLQRPTVVHKHIPMDAYEFWGESPFTGNLKTSQSLRELIKCEKDNTNRPKGTALHDVFWDMIFYQEFDFYSEDLDYFKFAVGDGSPNDTTDGATSYADKDNLLQAYVYYEIMQREYILGVRPLFALPNNVIKILARFDNVYDDLSGKTSLDNRMEFNASMPPLWG